MEGRRNFPRVWVCARVVLLLFRARVDDGADARTHATGRAPCTAA